MTNSVFFDFLSIVLYRERGRHYAVVVLSILIVFILSSAFFVSSSIRHALNSALEAEADFTVQRIRGGRAVEIPMEWVDEIADIHGIEKVSPRVHGRYFVKPKGKSFLVVGVDFLDEQSQRSLSKLLGGLDMKSFFKDGNMIVGSKVAKWMKKNYYDSSYRFLTPAGDFIELKVFKVLERKSDLVSADMIVVPIETARKILGTGEDFASDILFNVPNDDEWDNISDKVSALHYDIRVVSKKEMKKAYRELFSHRSGFFMLLFMLTLMAFVLLVYQRYNQVYSMEKRYIGILRALGWSIADVLKLKFSETLFIVIFSYLTGTALAYLYVFVAGAPVMRQIFFGEGNMNTAYELAPYLDFSVLVSIFLLYALPFIASVLIPVWRIAVTDPREAMI